MTSTTRRNLLRFNRIFMFTCANLASISQELGLPTRRWLTILDLLTQIWSLIIVITSLIKFFGFSKSTHTPPSPVSWRDLLLLNYLPRIDEFARLYFGLVTITVGAALSWRFYLNFYRPNGERIVNIVPMSIDSSESSSEDDSSLDQSKEKIEQQDYYEVWPLKCFKRGSLVEKFNAKCELIEFYLNGPTTSGHSYDPSLKIKTIENSYSEINLCFKPTNGSQFELIIGVRQLINKFISSRKVASKVYPLVPEKLPKRIGLLSRVHKKQMVDFKQTPYSADSSKIRLEQLDNQLATPMIQMYRIPIRSQNFLKDTSVARWDYLAKYVFSFTCFAILIACPLFYYSIQGLRSIHHMFGLTIQDRLTITSSKIIEKTISTLDESISTSSHQKLGSGHHQFYHLFLFHYGILEQGYVCTQAAMFFVFTNMFIMLFFADLMHKMQPIRYEMSLICKFYQMEGNRLPREQVYFQHLRLWAFYDYISLLDEFVCRYGIVSLGTLIIGLSFGQNYLRVSEPTLRLGIGAILFSNFMSYTYLHALSWLIERKVGLIVRHAAQLARCRRLYTTSKD